MSQKTESEKLFEVYLRKSEKILKYDYHPELGGRKKPDYIVCSKEGKILCEIKEFTDSLLERTLKVQKLAFFNLNVLLRSIRRKITDAAGQFKEYQDLKLPCIVVLCNPKGVLVDLSTEKILFAMYGDPEGKLVIDRSGRKKTKVFRIVLWQKWQIDKST